MAAKVQELLFKKLPKNYILKKPFLGTMILLGFFFFFSVLYRPFSVHGARSMGIGITIIFYALILFLPVLATLLVLKRVPFFGRESDWSLAKEVLSIVILLIVAGITVYFAGFLIEIPADRWNLNTFLNSLMIASMIVAIPLIFFTLSNYRHLFFPDILQFYNQPDNSSAAAPEHVIRISSQLKKEDLSFVPSQFVFAESDGNYVVFHLFENGRPVNKIIRNSINDIEQQLSHLQGLMRIHRAFIVNLSKVTSKKGNTLGYKLRLSGTDSEIPVSRNNTRNFDEQMKQFG